MPIDEILLAALARTIAATVGDGAVAVDLGGPGRSVLKPDVDLRRTVGWFTTVYPVALTCANGRGRERQATVGRRARHAESRPALWNRVRAVAVHVRANRTAARRACARPTSSSRTWARFLTCRPCSSDDAPVQFDSDTAMPVREAIPGLGHAVELRVYRSAGVLHLDWWYDSRRLEPAWRNRLPSGSRSR